MLKILLRARLAALKAWFSGASRTRQSQSRGKAVLFALLMLYAFGCIAFFTFGMFSQIAGPFSQSGLSWLYFALYALMNMSLMLIGSVFMAKSQLYEAKDNDFLLSMPIRPRDILASRMGMLLVINLGYGLLISAPAGIAWLVQGAPVTALQVVFFIVLSLGLALFTLALSALLAWIISICTSRVRRRTMLDTAFMLAFLLAYFWFCSQLNTIMASLAASGGSLAAKLGAVAPLVWFGKAIAEGDAASFLLTLAIMVAPFILAYALLSATFIRTATEKRGFAKIKYVDRGQKVSSPAAALLRREVLRFTSSSGYMINAGLGAVFLVVCAVLLVIKQQYVYAYMLGIPAFRPVVVPLIILALCLLVSMTYISAPSVSVEGKNLWIAQSLPVAASEILRAKLRLHLRVSLPPTVLAQAAVLYVFRPSGLDLVCAVLLPPAFCAFSDVLGLMANLRHPFMNWITETQAVKSGASVMIAMFGGWGAAILPFIAVLLLGNALSPSIIMLIYTAAVLVLSWLMYRWIMTRGAKIYSEL
jgi:ABC-2 type transport system permease protein